MGSFSQSRSPVLALPPQLPPQNTFAMDYHRPSFSSPFNASGISGANPSPPSSGWSNRTPTFTPSSTAGRKRSRDEAAENLEDDEYFPNVKTTLPPPVENEDEWEYGEGMTLIKPNQHYSITAESQSGTWVDERVEPQQSPTPAQSPQRPAYRPSKSQRLNLTATTDIPDDINLNGSSSLMTPLSSTSGNGVNPNSGPTEPTVDDFTRHLGIGWSSISTNTNLQAAARGWAKYIENHFPVTGANIRLQSRGLSSYLVEANEGYFLFGEDLKQGRLISTNLARTWENLRSNPPAFDGQMVLEASTSPKVDSTPSAEDLTMSATTTLQQETGHWSHGPAIQKFSQPAAQNVEVEMDMS